MILATVVDGIIEIGIRMPGDTVIRAIGLILDLTISKN